MRSAKFAALFSLRVFFNGEEVQPFWVMGLLLSSLRRNLIDPRRLIETPEMSVYFISFSFFFYPRGSGFNDTRETTLIYCTTAPTHQYHCGERFFCRSTDIGVYQSMNIQKYSAVVWKCGGKKIAWYYSAGDSTCFELNSTGNYNKTKTLQCCLGHFLSFLFSFFAFGYNLPG